MRKMGPFAVERERAVQAQPQVLPNSYSSAVYAWYACLVVRYQAQKDATS